MKLVIDCLTKNYFNFKGRARRKEYWLFFLASFCFQMLLGILEFVFFDKKIGGYGPLTGLGSALLFIPSLSVAFRRLHDINKSGWFWLTVLLPFAGIVWYLILVSKKGTSGENRYGEDPLKQSPPALNLSLS